MKAFLFFVLFTIMGVALFIGVVALLAEPAELNFNTYEFVAVKAIALFVVVVTYRAIVRTARMARATHVS